MDYLEFNNFFMDCVRGKFASDYGFNLSEEQSQYSIMSEEGRVDMSLGGLSTSIMNRVSGFYEEYKFMPRICEIATYCSIKRIENGVRILHQRVLKDSEKSFAIISNVCEISELTDYLATDNTFTWPYSLILPTYEESMHALCKRGGFKLDKELTCIVKHHVVPEDLHTVMCREQDDILALLKETTRR